MLRVESGVSQQRLWFDIQRVLAEIQRICVDARAIALLNQRRIAEAKGFEELLERVSLMPGCAVDARFDEAEALSVGPAFVAKHPAGTGVDVVAIRSQLRKQLSWLKGRLAEELTEREVYNSLFPIVIYTDELVHVATEGESTKWEPLQGELYDVDNGGEVFFSGIDILLHKADTHPLIFEIYFFCLRDGFVGQYHGQPGRIDDYCRRLAEHIPTTLPGSDGIADGPAASVRLLRFPVRSYLLSAVGVVSLWFGLRAFATYEIEEDILRSGRGSVQKTSLASEPPSNTRAGSTKVGSIEDQEEMN